MYSKMSQYIHIYYKTHMFQHIDIYSTMICSHLYIKSGIITMPNTSMIKEIYFPSLIFVL